MVEALTLDHSRWMIALKDDSGYYNISKLKIYSEAQALYAASLYELSKSIDHTVDNETSNVGINAGSILKLCNMGVLVLKVPGYPLWVVSNSKDHYALYTTYEKASNAYQKVILQELKDMYSNNKEDE